MKIYICTPIRERRHSRKVCKFLEKLGHQVYWPPRDTATKDEKRAFNLNSQAIREAKVFLAFLKEPGLDASWEVGFAYGLGKRVIGYGMGDRYKKSPMMIHSIKEMVDSTSKLEKALAKK